MRLYLVLIPLAAMAGAATAQPAPATAPIEPIAFPLALTDPALADRLGSVMQSLSKALLNLPVGEVQAAIEGRPATAADKRMTVRDIGRRDDPDFERNLDRQLADSRAGIQAGMKAMVSALPAMMKGMNEVAREIEKATANLPRPDYPRR